MGKIYRLRASLSRSVGSIKAGTAFGSESGRSVHRHAPIRRVAGAAIILRSAKTILIKI
jgi:hypothetical protein